MKLLLFIGILLLSLSCTRTDSGLVFGTPDYESREIQVTELDLKILQKTYELLNNEDSWDNRPIRNCNGLTIYTLYCALEKASLVVNGKYIHRQAALQEIRFVIDDKFKSRWSVHRLADFNTHKNTTFKDIKYVIEQAMVVVKQKLKTD